ncbi:flagellar biosynthesis protein FlhA [Stenotrophomonas aracearum]|jgi:flagellar biosynthesis protein FlhA|uniref:Flagellar biosynthesis protein FlhA n=1 Tax=Stenotrophomonas aracearum TaxID=3003272 RepID=A0ABY9YD47_9GAMM|nr:flagellar biosynthesis protein FlhA [Stenotrophomonas sp. A5588]WNH48600.1 flagellar biosynthesis protein FlhA [Stenotrophomonas sp. A5588]
MKALFAQLWEGKRDLAMVALVLGVLIVLFVPVPPMLLDLLLVLNISMALLILLVTFFTDSPLKFSTFPTILLLSTLFRLALNVSATRLILEGADAGRVINAIGEFVVGGNYIVGIVVFIILVVVQYVVVTSGAQRVAEVAARFTLDSMPGKQMSIDADMNMGLIDEKEARERRRQIEREANFYGAMDGATKFVKGDAIAGIVIILTNIVGGLAIGIAQLGLPWGEAVQRFTLLTIGDGIVTQIPSLVIAVATGIIITRAAADAQLGSEIPKQILANPKALVIVAVVLLIVLVLPGFPVAPVLVVLCILGALAWLAMRSEQARQAEEHTDIELPRLEAGAVAPQEIGQLLRIEPIEVRLGGALFDTFTGPDSDLAERIEHLRRQFAQDLGFVMPKVQQQRSELPPESYEVHFHGCRVGQGSLMTDRVLAINPGGQRARLEGPDTRDPAYGLPAQWIEPQARQTARTAGYTLVEPDTVLITHLSELVKRQSADLLTRQDTERMLQRVREQNASLVEELVPAILSYSEVQKVLQLLLREQVSVRHLEAILEVLVDAGRTVKNAEDLAERVRERLGGSICQSLRDANGDLHVMTLAPELEHELLSSVRGSEGRGSLFGEIAQLDGFMKSLAAQSESMMGRNLVPVLLCPGPVRRSLRQLLSRSMPYLAVISLNEIPATLPVRSFAAIRSQ